MASFEVEGKMYCQDNTGQDIYYDSVDDLHEEFFDAVTKSESPEDICLIGAGLGGGFGNTAELKVIKYREAMAIEDKSQWEQAVKEEKEQFEKKSLYKIIKKVEVPNDSKFLSSTWAMKKKSNGIY